MKIKLLLFGSLVDATGGKTEIVLENVQDIDSVTKLLLEDYPALAGHTFRIAVNQQITGDNQKLGNNDIVALLPPFAGG